MKKTMPKKEILFRTLSSILAVVAFAFITYVVLLSLSTKESKNEPPQLIKNGWELVNSKVCPVEFQLPSQDSYVPGYFDNSKIGSKYWVIEEQTSDLLSNSSSFYIGYLPDGISKNQLGCEKGCATETIISITCINKDTRSIDQIVDSIESSYKNQYNSEVVVMTKKASKWGFESQIIDLNINNPKYSNSNVLIKGNSTTLLIEYYGNQKLVDEVMNSLVIEK